MGNILLNSFKKDYYPFPKDFTFSQEYFLFYAGLILRPLLRSRRGLSHTPLNPADISIGTAEAIVPDDLYKFFHTVLSPGPPEFCTETVHAENPVIHRHVLSLSQDLLYMFSRGECKTPKHLGLGIAVHQLTQSKNIVTMLNKNGQCISYDDIQRIDACWAEDQYQPAAFIPVSMKQGRVTRGQVITLTELQKL